MQSHVNILQEKIIISGNLQRENVSFIGQVTVAGNSQKLQDIFPAIKILNGADHKVTSNIELNKKLLKFHDIELSSGKIFANGNANFSLEDNKLDLQLKLNPGNIDIKITPLEKEKNNNNFYERLSITSTSLKPLFDELAINIATIPKPLLNQPFVFSTSALYRDQDFSLDDINLSISKANLKGNLRLKNWQKNMLATYSLNAHDIPALVSLLAINLPVQLNDLVITGETSADKGRVKTNTTLMFLNATTNIQGDIAIEKSIKPNLTIQSSGENLGSIINELTVSSASTLPFGNYSLLWHLKGDIAKTIKINIDKLAVTVKNSPSSLTGNIEINLTAAQPKISSDIKITSLNLDALSNGPTNNKSVNYNQGTSTEQSNKPVSSTPWSRNKIDLSFLKSFNGNLTLYIQKIIKGDLIFDTIQTTMSLSNGVLNITNLNGKLYGGEIELSGQISSHNNQAINLNTNLKGAQLRNIIKQEGKIKVTQGVVNFRAGINTLGHSQLQYVNNLGGSTTLTATEGAISGFDLQKILNNLKTTKNLEGILKILDISFSGGETRFQNLILATEIKNGVANIVQGKLSSEESEMTAQGNIDLPKYYCDIEGIVALDIKKSLPPFKVRFHGALNNIQHKLDTQLLQQYLIKNVLSNVIEKAGQSKKPVELLKNLIGVEQGQNTDEVQKDRSSAPASNKSPVQELQNIGKELKGLFK
ncbi:AsmA-like C-terminal region-containing protein [Candidatus Tisiphia endosymbiont of Nemotelus uliginosus]|uniref:AsmA family protein n=1 Tax=Candidatus Tisiphia endosymbiont of Nemotelus uliginosus TaxID=3077926 RepID=UPI0035C8C2AE